MDTDVVFLGKDGRECELFVRWVKVIAFQAGKQDDDKWIAQYAAIHLDGEALRWFAELDLETQNRWSLLSRALVRQYPSDKNDK